MIPNFLHPAFKPFFFLFSPLFFLGNKTPRWESSERMEKQNLENQIRLSSTSANPGGVFVVGELGGILAARIFLDSWNSHPDRARPGAGMKP